MGRPDSLEKTWCWERLRAGGEGDDRGWDGWMASLTQWTWVCVDSRSWWWTGRPGVLRFMGLQRVGHDWVTELNCNCKFSASVRCRYFKKHLSGFTGQEYFSSTCTKSMKVQEGDPSISQSGGRGCRNLASPGAWSREKVLPHLYPYPSSIWITNQSAFFFVFFCILESLYF